MLAQLVRMLHWLLQGGLDLYTGKPEHFMNIDNVVTSHNKDQDKQTVQKSQTNL